MKVADLKILLERYPDDFEVVLSSDGEGNNFSPLDDVVGGKYEETNTWSGDFDPDDAVVNSICLWPTN